MAVRGYQDDKGRTRYAVEFQQGHARIYRRAPPGVTYAQAREWETKLRRGLFDGDALGHKPDVYLEDVIRQWLETRPHKGHRGLLSRANLLAEFVQGKLASQAPEVAAEARKAWATATPLGRSGIGMSDSTVAVRLAALKAALTWAWETDLIPENYGARIKIKEPKNGREVYLTRAEVLTLCQFSSPEVGAAIMISAYSGLRAAECLSLRRDDLQQHSLRVMGKGDKPRVVPVPASLLPSLRALPLGLSYRQLSDGFNEARDAAGLGPEVTFHTLRHSFASWLINEGVDLYTVGRLLGHSNPKTTMRYSHLVQATLRKAVNKLR